MESRPFEPKLPEIAEREQTPLARSLLQVIADLQAQNRRLEDEIRRLKGGPPRPQLKPNTPEVGVAAALNPTDAALPRRRGHPRRAKTAERVIHAICQVVLAHVPGGARFQGDRAHGVQDVVIRLHNTGYEREQWQCPTGASVTAPVPVAVRGGHDGPRLVTYLLPQQYHAHVTPPILLAQVRAWGTAISAGQLNRLLTEGHEDFHQEKTAIKTVGLAVSSHVQTDGTGARHPGKNGYSTGLGNEWFARFASTESKSRVNCLEPLQSERCSAINPAALAYMTGRGGAAGHRERLAADPVGLSDPAAWAAYRRRHLVDSPRAIALVAEGALLGGLVMQGVRLDLRLLSDDAGQFAPFIHALCRVHAERPLQPRLPLNEADRAAITDGQDRVRKRYRALTVYRQEPTPAAKAAIHAPFDTLCATVPRANPSIRYCAASGATGTNGAGCWTTPLCPRTTIAASTTSGIWSRSARSVPAPGVRPGDDVATPASASRRPA